MDFSPFSLCIITCLLVNLYIMKKKKKYRIQRSESIVLKYSYTYV